MGILEKCGTVEELRVYDERHCDLCCSDNETIYYRVIRPSGLEMLVTCYSGCTGMEIRNIEKMTKLLASKLNNANSLKVQSFFCNKEF